MKIIIKICFVIILLQMIFSSCAIHERNINCLNGPAERDSVISKIISFAYDSLYFKYRDIQYQEDHTRRYFYFLDDTLLNGKIKGSFNPQYHFIKINDFGLRSSDPEDSLYLRTLYYIKKLHKDDSMTYSALLVLAGVVHVPDGNYSYPFAHTSYDLKVHKNSCIYTIDRIASFYD